MTDPALRRALYLAGLKLDEQELVAVEEAVATTGMTIGEVVRVLMPPQPSIAEIEDALATNGWQRLLGRLRRRWWRMVWAVRRWSDA